MSHQHIFCSWADNQLWLGWDLSRLWIAEGFRSCLIKPSQSPGPARSPRARQCVLWNQSTFCLKGKISLPNPGNRAMPNWGFKDYFFSSLIRPHINSSLSKSSPIRHSLLQFTVRRNQCLPRSCPPQGTPQDLLSITEFMGGEQSLFNL